MNFTVHQICEILQCAHYNRAFYDFRLYILETDSRALFKPEQSLFCALKGSRTDGHEYIPKLFKQGVRVFLVRSDFVSDLNDICLIRVPDVLKAIQTLAIAHRKQFNIPVIGITGSNGKTIVKEWLYNLLQNKFRICKNPKSYNSQLGVALSVLELNESHELGIFEAGISARGEMKTLAEMIQATIGLITNIGDAHQAGFSGMDEKTREKLSLFASVDKLLYRKDYQSIDYHIGHLNKSISWSQKLEADYIIEQLKKSNDQLQIQLRHDKERYQFNINFGDEASLENIMHCLVLAIELGLTEEEIQAGLHHLHNMPMRLEQKEGLNGCVLINDSYSLDYKSLQLALQFVDQQDRHLPRTLVLSDFPEQKSTGELWKAVAELLSKYRIQRIITVGQDINGLINHLLQDIAHIHFESSEQLLASVDSLHFDHELILIKSARKYRLERFFQQLSLSTHDTILEIDLKSIKHNVSVFRSELKPDTKLMAIVKAAAYGSGQYEIARLLEHLGVDYLAVAYLDEGIVLRNKGIQMPIMVMNTGRADFNLFLENRLEPEIFSNSQLKRMINEVGANTPFTIHIKLDTGMHRLGFLEDDIPELIRILKANQQLRVASIFSHLASSDQEKFDDFTNVQAARFDKMTAQLLPIFDDPPLLHLLNSGGIARHPDCQYDMVRLGIGMYGFDSDPLMARKLEKAHTLKTRISQIKMVEPQETISYNRSGSLPSGGKIGVLAIGYADGLPRNAGLNGYMVALNRQRAGIVGLVCMDMCMIDLSGVENTSEGMEVEVFGKNAALEELAELTGTIPYEILSRISMRVKRIFLQD